MAINHTKDPWDRLEGESSRAYDRFVAYLEMGPRRSLEKLRKEIGQGKHYINQLKRWSGSFNWVQRAKAYDASELQEKIESRTEERERGRQVFVSAAEEAAQGVLDIARDENNPPSVRLAAYRDALDRAGAVAPRRYELSAGKGLGISVQLQEDAGQLSPEQLAKVCELIGEPEEGDE